MRRPSRETQIFSLSALDILAMATGVFVVMVTVMMPYYQRTLDAYAATEKAREGTAAALAAKAALEDETAAARVQAGRTEEEAAALAAQKAALDEQIAEIQQKIGRLQAAAARPIAKRRDPIKTSPSAVVDRLDLVFVMDATHSMRPAIREITLSLRSISRVLEKLVASVRIGFVAYTDRDTGYRPVWSAPLTNTGAGLERVLSFIQDIDVVGSTSVPEDVELGMQAAARMDWRRGAKRVMIVIGDAEPHFGDERIAFDIAARFAREAPDSAVSSLYVSTPLSRRHGDQAAYFFDRLARAGGGVYNDHNGRMFESVILSVLTE